MGYLPLGWIAFSDRVLGFGSVAMLKTLLCDLFGIEVPIILAPMGTCTSAELAAAVSNEGGLGGYKEIGGGCWSGFDFRKPRRRFDIRD